VRTRVLLRWLQRRQEALYAALLRLAALSPEEQSAVLQSL